MIAVDLVQQARTYGVTLTPLPDGGLKLKGKPHIPTELTAAVREHKSEILALLQSCVTMVDAYRRYWSLPESAPMEVFQAAHAEIVTLEAQAEPLMAWRTLRETAKVWHRESGTCPFCRERGELHLPAEQPELELRGVG